MSICSPFKRCTKFKKKKNQVPTCGGEDTVGTYKFLDRPIAPHIKSKERNFLDAWAVAWFGWMTVDVYLHERERESTQNISNRQRRLAVSPKEIPVNNNTVSAFSTDQVSTSKYWSHNVTKLWFYIKPAGPTWDRYEIIYSSNGLITAQMFVIWLKRDF